MASIGFLRTLFARMGELHLQAFAAGLAYGTVFALLPMLALFVLLIGVFNATELVTSGIDELRSVLPADALLLVEERLLSVATTNDQASFGVGVVVSALVALYGASGAMRRVMEALNVVHRAEESRPFVRKLLVSVAMAIGAIAIIFATLVVTVVGGDVASAAFDVIGLGSTAELAWGVARWPVLLVLAWAGIAGAYRWAPCARQVGGLLTPGTIVATVGWVLFSLAFSWYVGGIGEVSDSWGPVAGVIVLLLYLQYAGLIVLLGALIDVELYDRDNATSSVRRWLRVPAKRA